MSIEKIKADDLRRMDGKEGLVLQGCGGELQEWLDGINDLFTKEKLLLDGTKFKNIYAFEHDSLTNLLFPFDGSAKLDIGRLAVWRLQTHGEFGGTWLSDYVPNHFGGFAEEQQKEEMCSRITETAVAFREKWNVEQAQDDEPIQTM